MSGDSELGRRAEAARWLDIADEDIAAAKLCLNASLNSVAAYHCQQAVEKIAKALLVAAGTPFPKTHDLVSLGALTAPLYPKLASSLASLEAITVWGFAFRYPPEEEANAASPQKVEIRARLDEIGALRRGAAASIEQVIARPMA